MRYRLLYLHFTAFVLGYLSSSVHALWLGGWSAFRESVGPLLMFVCGLAMGAIRSGGEIPVFEKFQMRMMRWDKGESSSPTKQSWKPLKPPFRESEV